MHLFHNNILLTLLLVYLMVQLKILFINRLAQLTRVTTQSDICCPPTLYVCALYAQVTADTRLPTFVCQLKAFDEILLCTKRLRSALSHWGNLTGLCWFPPIGTTIEYCLSTLETSSKCFIIQQIFKQSHLQLAFIVQLAYTSSKHPSLWPVHPVIKFEMYWRENSLNQFLQCFVMIFTLYRNKLQKISIWRLLCLCKKIYIFCVWLRLLSKCINLLLLRIFL